MELESISSNMRVWSILKWVYFYQFLAEKPGGRIVLWRTIVDCTDAVHRSIRIGVFVPHSTAANTGQALRRIPITLIYSSTVSNNCDICWMGYYGRTSIRLSQHYFLELVLQVFYPALLVGSQRNSQASKQHCLHVRSPIRGSRILPRDQWLEQKFWSS